MFSKRLIAWAILILSSGLVFAATPYSTIMEAAKANSPQLQNA